MWLAAGAVTIIAMTVVVYVPAMSGGFILDDEMLVAQNKLLYDADADGLRRIWCTTDAPDYWPMTYTSFWLEWRLWGPRPTGYIVDNVALHIASALLIWAVLRKLPIPGAFLAALIFALHPVNVESVAWISQRKDALAVFFFLLSILWYLKSNIGVCPRAGLEFFGTADPAARAGETPASQVMPARPLRWY